MAASERFGRSIIVRLGCRQRRPRSFATDPEGAVSSNRWANASRKDDSPRFADWLAVGTGRIAIQQRHKIRISVVLLTVIGMGPHVRIRRYYRDFSNF